MYKNNLCFMIKYGILFTKKEMGNLYAEIMDAGRDA